MSGFHHTRITDAVHGTFGLSKLEADIIATPIFQRLHNIRQLGLAHLVFPGADYSRFAHSLGACHIAGRMMRAINLNCGPGKKFEDRDVQLYRLAGLLHDVGHYPFSHLTETEIEDHYSQTLLAADNGSEGRTSAGHGEHLEEPMVAYDHEMVGRTIIENDEGIKSVLRNYNFSPDDVRSIFSRENPNELANIVSSDLDCDRLDYLMRTAHSAGLPYGQIDLEYLIAQMTIDNEGRLCLRQKAFRAADHFLISRYYDYTQLVFHKTVVGLELVMKRLIATLLSKNYVDFSAKTVLSLIQAGQYSLYDDQFIISLIRRLAQDNRDDSVLLEQIASVLDRHPPKLVVSVEAIGPTTKERGREHKNLRRQLEEKKQQACEKFSIDPRLWYIWSRSINLSKIGSSIPLSDATKAAFEEEASQAIRIMAGAEPFGNTSRPLVELDYSLMKGLSQNRFYGLRLYVNLPPDMTSKRTEIQKFFRDEMPDFPFYP